MAMLKMSDLWRWEGPLDRGAYAAWGLILVAIKFGFDRMLAASFGRSWVLFAYLEPGNGEDLLHLSPASQLFYATLVACSIPFIYVGFVMTLRRVRTLGLPAPLAALFFVPLLNLFTFIALSVLPDRTPEPGPGGDRLRAWLDAFIPRSQLGAAALSIVLTAFVGVIITVFAVFALSDYGWGLFVGLPFLLGLNAVLLATWHQPRSLSACLLTALLSAVVLGGALLALAFEGVICILMAAPIGLVLAAVGGLVGYALQRRPSAPLPVPPALALLLVVLPLTMGAEARSGVVAPLFEVVTAVEVDAPPEQVWPHVITFSELPPPDTWLFKTGIAYPVRARIDGEGPGAIRRCEFSTGAFVEPITTWNPPTLLAFDVTAQPRPMQELSPYGTIEAPHLDNFLRSEHGQFKLTALPGGRTRLEGTTWYRHVIWPAAYWRLYSDGIIHQIHARVLAHVKALAEGRARPS